MQKMQEASEFRRSRISGVKLSPEINARNHSATSDLAHSTPPDAYEVNSTSKFKSDSWAAEARSAAIPKASSTAPVGTYEYQM